MTISVGDRIPEIALVRASAGGPQPISTGAFLAGRRIVLFSVPGAFTPTCSARHLPGFVDAAAAIRAKGVDEIACTAVNDAFVLWAWAKSAGAEAAVTMLADGNADLVTALGLVTDRRAIGMGLRGQRFSMLIEDCVVRILNVEAAGAYNVSSAEYLLGQL